MLDHDLFGQRPDLSARHLPGGVAPSRHALERQRYIEEKCARLDAEAGERQRQAFERRAERAASMLERSFRAMFAVLMRKPSGGAAARGGHWG